jgi:hypothetical protein
MELHFLPPAPRHLDEASAEVCACTIWTDERPMRGLAGMLDWRLGGKLSALLKSGFLLGELGEALLVPGKPNLPFEKVLVVGLGARSGFGDGTFRLAVQQMARALEGMRVRRAVVELPGRATGAIDPEQAIAVALECVGASPEHDAWWLVDDPAVEKAMEPRLRSRRTATLRA